MPRALWPPLSILVLLLARGFRTGLLSALVLFAGVASSFFVLALYLQQGRGLAPLPSGLVFTAMALAFTVTSLLAGRIGRSMGRAPLAPGALGMALGLGGLVLTVRWIGVVGGSVAWLLPALAVDGAGMGLVMAPLAATVLVGMPSHHAGAAAGLLVTVQQFANALGVALVGLVFFGLLRHGGYDEAFTASLACLAVLALVLAALVWRLAAHRITRWVRHWVTHWSGGSLLPLIAHDTVAHDEVGKGTFARARSRSTPSRHNTIFTGPV